MCQIIWLSLAVRAGSFGSQTALHLLSILALIIQPNLLMFWLTIGMCARISLKLFHVILLNLIISRIQLFYFVWCKKIHHYNTCIELINSERCRSPFRSKQTHCICSLYVTILMRLWCPYQIINCPKQKPFQTSRTQNGARCAIQQIKKKSQCAKQQHQTVLIVKHCKTVEYVIIIGRSRNRLSDGSRFPSFTSRSRLVRYRPRTSTWQ